MLSPFLCTLSIIFFLILTMGHDATLASFPSPQQRCLSEFTMVLVFFLFEPSTGFSVMGSVHDHKSPEAITLFKLVPHFDPVRHLGISMHMRFFGFVDASEYCLSGSIGRPRCFAYEQHSRVAGIRRCDHPHQRLPWMQDVSGSAAPPVQPGTAKTRRQPAFPLPRSKQNRRAAVFGEA
jgi:hypothetical protein